MAGSNANQLMPKCRESRNKLTAFLSYELQINSSVENGLIYPCTFSNKLPIRGAAF
jgi:hypothetical protein